MMHAVDQAIVAGTDQRKRITLPRWLAVVLALVIWPVAIPLVHGVLPWSLSYLGARFGWQQGRPGSWNLPGMALVLAGAALIIWALVVHLAEIPERLELEWTPKYLLKHGPYALTRNPMYIAVMSLWLGWALFYGSVAVLAGCGVSWLVTRFLVLREERALEARFGARFVAYRKSVPRWLGKSQDEFKNDRNA